MVPLLSQWLALPVERRMRTYCGTNQTRRHHLQPCWSRASPRGKSGKRKQTGSDNRAFSVFSGTTLPRVQRQKRGGGYREEAVPCKAANGNVAIPEGVQAPFEPLDISGADHLAR